MANTSVAEPPPGNEVNRHWKIKTGARTGHAVAGIGVEAAKQATATSAVPIMQAIAAGTGAAVSATGIGLIVAGGALTVASSGIAARSAWKTRRHRHNLREILANISSHLYDDCYEVSETGQMSRGNRFSHEVIARDALPYIISKKGAKYHRKAASAVPGVAMLESMRAIGKAGWKKFRGTKGKNRARYARWMVQHLHTHDCALVEAIISELYSYEEMQWIKYHADYDVAVNLLMEKMRST